MQPFPWKDIDRFIENQLIPLFRQEGNFPSEEQISQKLKEFIGSNPGVQFELNAVWARLYIRASGPDYMPDKQRLGALEEALFQIVKSK